MNRVLHSAALPIASAALLVLAAAGPTAAQTALLDIRTGTGVEVTTIRTDSMRLLVPLHLVAGGIVFPDGTIQSTAATGAAAGGSAAAADSSSAAEPATVVARDDAGGFQAGPTVFSVESGGSAPLKASTAGGGSAGVFEVANTASGASALYASTEGTGAAVFGHTDGSGWAGYFRVSGLSGNSNPAVYALTRADGPAGAFEIDNAGSTADALRVETNGAGSAIETWSTGAGPSIFGYTTGTGSAGRFRINNTGAAAAALHVETNGTGNAVYAYNTGSGGHAGRFVNDNPGNGQAALVAINDNGSALAVQGGGSYDMTPLAWLFALNGDGAALRLTGSSEATNILEADGSGRVFRVTYGGNVYADGTFNGGGADLAESFAVEGDADGYEPGDVLAISTSTDRTMEKAAEPYSTRVAGVYATKPGVLLGEHGADGAPGDEVPLGVVGVIPTKVTAEGGPIRRGDLLVTSSTPGHAMRGDPDRIGFGMVLGKALEPFDGPGAGVIQVLVNVK